MIGDGGEEEEEEEERTYSHCVHQVRDPLKALRVVRQAFSLSGINTSSLMTPERVRESFYWFG